MGLFSELQVKITGNIAGAQKAFREINADLAKMSTDAGKSSIGFQKLGATLSSLGTSGLVVSAGIVGIGGASLRAAAGMESAQVAMGTMLRSTSAAKVEMEKLKAFAAATPFQFPELVDASRRMLALGFAASDTIPMLRTVGNAASALGIGAEGMQRIILALGQIKAKGTLQAEEMRQLAEAGIPAWQALADKIGVTVPEAMKLVEQRAISSATAIAAVTEVMNSRFGGGMEAQAKTLGGIWSNLKDQINFTLADIGSVLAPSAKQFMVDYVQPLLAGIKSLAEEFANLPEPIKQGMIAAAGVTAVAGPAAFTLGQMTSTVSMLALAWGPLSKAFAIGAASLAKFGLALGGMALGAQAAAMSASALAATIAGVGVVIGLGIYKVLEMVDAWERMKRAQDELVQAEQRDEASRERTLRALTKQGANLTAIEKAWRAGALATKDFDQALRDAGLALGASHTAAAQLEGTLERLGAKTTKQLQAELKKAKEELVQINQAYKEGVVGADALSKAQDKVRSIMELLHPSVKATASAMNELGGAMQGPTSLAEELNEAFGERLRADAAALVKLLVDAKMRTGEFAKAIETIPSKISIAIDFEPVDMASVFEDMGVEQGQRRAAEGLDNLRKQSKVWLDGWKSDQKQASKAMQQVSLITNDLARDLAKLTLHGGKFGEVMTSMAKSVGEALLRHIYEAALRPIMKSITDIMAKLPGLGSIFSSGGSAASLPSYVSALNPVSGGGGGGGGASSAMSGAMGWVGVGAGVATAISSVIGNFQMSGMNENLQLIEESTRWTKIDIHNLLPKLTNEFASALPGIHARLVEFRSVGMGVWPQAGYDWAGMGGNGIQVNMTGMVYGGSAGISQFADLLIAELRKKGLRI